MSEISERYARLSSAFAAKVAAVPPDRWASPTPCGEWTVRDLVRHVVDIHGMFLGLVGRELGAIVSVDDDPVAAIGAARAVVQADLDDPGRAGAGFEGFFGPTTFEMSIDRFVNFDLVVHGWDLARATGLDERIDPGDIARVAAGVAAFGDTLYSSGVCAAPLDAPPRADDQTRLMASLGRRSWP